MLNNIKTISYYTAKEILKSKVLLSVIIIGLLQFVLTYVAYSFTYGEPSRVALDFGLGTLSLSCVGIAIFIGVGLLSDEIDNRTVYMIISRPVKRIEFLIGRLCGLIIVLILNTLILSLISLSLYFFIGGSFQMIILWTIILILIEALIALGVVSTFSLITNKTMSVIFTVLLYVLGHGIDATKLTTFVQQRPLLGFIIDAYHFILPGFYRLNLKDYVLYEQMIDFSYFLSSFFYGLFYLLFLVFLSVFIFNKKNLD